MEKYQKKFNQLLQKKRCTLKEILDLVLAIRTAINDVSYNQGSVVVQNVSNTASQCTRNTPLLCNGAWNCTLEPEVVTECVETSDWDQFGIMQHFKEFASSALFPDVPNQGGIICEDYLQCLWSAEQDTQKRKLRDLLQKIFRSCFQNFTVEEKEAWMCIKCGMDIDELSPGLANSNHFVSDEDWKKDFPNIEW